MKAALVSSRYISRKGQKMKLSEVPPSAVKEKRVFRLEDIEDPYASPINQTLFRKNQLLRAKVPTPLTARSTQLGTGQISSGISSNRPRSPQTGLLLSAYDQELEDLQGKIDELATRRDLIREQSRVEREALKMDYQTRREKVRTSLAGMEDDQSEDYKEKESLLSSLSQELARGTEEIDTKLATLEQEFEVQAGRISARRKILGAMRDEKASDFREPETNRFYSSLDRAGMRSSEEGQDSPERPSQSPRTPSPGLVTPGGFQISPDDVLEEYVFVEYRSMTALLDSHIAVHDMGGGFIDEMGNYESPSSQRTANRIKLWKAMSASLATSAFGYLTMLGPTSDIASKDQIHRYDVAALFSRVLELSTVESNKLYTGLLNEQTNLGIRNNEPYLQFMVRVQNLIRRCNEANVEVNYFLINKGMAEGVLATEHMDKDGQDYETEYIAINRYDKNANFKQQALFRSKTEYLRQRAITILSRRTGTGKQSTIAFQASTKPEKNSKGKKKKGKANAADASESSRKDLPPTPGQCKHFWMNESCPYGNSCRYDHHGPRKNQKKGPSAKLAGQKKPNKKGASKANKDKNYCGVDGHKGHFEEDCWSNHPEKSPWNKGKANSAEAKYPEGSQSKDGKESKKKVTIRTDLNTATSNLSHASWRDGSEPAEDPDYDPSVISNRARANLASTGKGTGRLSGFGTGFTRLLLLFSILGCVLGETLPIINSEPPANAVEPYSWGRPALWALPAILPILFLPRVRNEDPPNVTRVQSENACTALLGDATASSLIANDVTKAPEGIFEAIIDTGSSHLITNTELDFVPGTCRSQRTDIQLAKKGSTMRSNKTGTVRLLGSDGTLITFKNALYVPEAQSKLLSVGNLDSQGYSIIFGGNACELRKGGSTKALQRRKARFDSLYSLRLPLAAGPTASACTAATVPETTSSVAVSFLSPVYTGDLSRSQLLHNRMAHVCTKTLRRAYPDVQFDSKCLCPSCVHGKMHSFTFPKTSKSTRTWDPGQYVHMDLAGPFWPTWAGKRYRALFLDERSDVAFTVLLRTKDEQTQALETYRTFIKTQYGITVTHEKSDYGGEYVSNASAERLESTGVRPEWSGPGAPQQNGKPERKHRTLDEAIRTVMDHAGAPADMWGEANGYVVFTHNHTPYELDPGTKTWRSRLQILEGEDARLDLDRLRTFGCEAWAYIPKGRRDGPKSHLQLRARHCVFLGYEPMAAVYRLWDLDKKKVIRCARQHVICNEASFPWRARKASYTESQLNSPFSHIIPGVSFGEDNDPISFQNEEDEAYDEEPPETLETDPGISFVPESPRKSPGVAYGPPAEALLPADRVLVPLPQPTPAPTVAGGGDLPPQQSPAAEAPPSILNVPPRRLTFGSPEVSLPTPRPTPRKTSPTSRSPDAPPQPLRRSKRGWHPSEKNLQGLAVTPDRPSHRPPASPGTSPSYSQTPGLSPIPEDHFSPPQPEPVAPTPVPAKPKRKLPTSNGTWKGRLRARARNHGGGAQARLGWTQLAPDDDYPHRTSTSYQEVYGEDVEEILNKIHTNCISDGEDRTPGWAPPDWDAFADDLDSNRIAAHPVYSVRDDTVYTSRTCHDQTVCAMIAGEITGARVTPAVPMTKERGVPPPANRRQAQKSKEWKYYHMAEHEEYKTHIQNETWDLTPPGDVPKDARILPTKWAYDDKCDDAGNVIGAKARLCARGDRQIYGVDYFETFSAVMNIRTFRMCLAILNLYASLSMEHWDIKAAFINAPLEEELYIRQPEGHVVPGKESWLCRLNKALYGACQASRAWFKYLAGLLADAGMKPLKSDPATYIIREGTSWIIMPTHVDDLFPLTNDVSLRDKVFKKLASKVTIKSLGEISCALRTNIQRDKKGGFLKISIAPYIRDMLERFGLQNSTPRVTPGNVDDQITEADLPTTDEERKALAKLPFRELLGCLWWPTWMCRPDILYHVHECSRHVSKPSRKLWTKLEAICRYLKGTMDYGVVMKRPKDLSQFHLDPLEAWVDGDWAGCKNSRKSRTGGLLYFYGMLISWMSEMQTAVALSSAESEYYGIIKMGKQVLWARKVSEELGYPCQLPTAIRCDNTAAIGQTKGNSFAKAAKHYDLAMHAAADWVAQNKIRVPHVSTDEQKANGLTKALGPMEYTSDRDRMMGGIGSQSHFPSVLGPVSGDAPTTSTANHARCFVAFKSNRHDPGLNENSDPGTVGPNFILTQVAGCPGENGTEPDKPGGGPEQFPDLGTSILPGIRTRGLEPPGHPISGGPDHLFGLGTNPLFGVRELEAPDDQISGRLDSLEILSQDGGRNSILPQVTADTTLSTWNMADWGKQDTNAPKSTNGIEEMELPRDSSLFSALPFCTHLCPLDVPDPDQGTLGETPMPGKTPDKEKRRETTSTPKASSSTSSSSSTPSSSSLSDPDGTNPQDFANLKYKYDLLTMEHETLMGQLKLKEKMHTTMEERVNKLSEELASKTTALAQFQADAASTSEESSNAESKEWEAYVRGCQDIVISELLKHLGRGNSVIKGLREQISDFGTALSTLLSQPSSIELAGKWQLIDEPEAASGKIRGPPNAAVALDYMQTPDKMRLEIHHHETNRVEGAPFAIRFCKPGFSIRPSSIPGHGSGCAQKYKIAFGPDPGNEKKVCLGRNCKLKWPIPTNSPLAGFHYHLKAAGEEPPPNIGGEPGGHSSGADGGEEAGEDAPEKEGTKTAPKRKKKEDAGTPGEGQKEKKPKPDGTSAKTATGSQPDGLSPHQGVRKSVRIQLQQRKEADGEVINLASDEDDGETDLPPGENLQSVEDTVDGEDSINPEETPTEIPQLPKTTKPTQGVYQHITEFEEDLSKEAVSWHLAIYESKQAALNRPDSPAELEGFCIADDSPQIQSPESAASLIALAAHRMGGWDVHLSPPDSDPENKSSSSSSSPPKRNFKPPKRENELDPAHFQVPLNKKHAMEDLYRSNGLGGAAPDLSDSEDSEDEKETLAAEDVADNKQDPAREGEPGATASGTVQEQEPPDPETFDYMIQQFAISNAPSCYVPLDYDPFSSMLTWRLYGTWTPGDEAQPKTTSLGKRALNLEPYLPFAARIHPEIKQLDSESPYTAPEGSYGLKRHQSRFLLYFYDQLCETALQFSGYPLYERYLMAAGCKDEEIVLEMYMLDVRNIISMIEKVPFGLAAFWSTPITEPKQVRDHVTLFHKYILADPDERVHLFQAHRRALAGKSGHKPPGLTFHLHAPTSLDDYVHPLHRSSPNFTDKKLKEFFGPVMLGANDIFPSPSHNPASPYDRTYPKLKLGEGVTTRHQDCFQPRHQQGRVGRCWSWKNWNQQRVWKAATADVVEYLLHRAHFVRPLVFELACGHEVEKSCPECQIYGSLLGLYAGDIGHGEWVATGSWHEHLIANPRPDQILYPRSLDMGPMDSIEQRLQELLKFADTNRPDSDLHSACRSMKLCSVGVMDQPGCACEGEAMETHERCMHVIPPAHARIFFSTAEQDDTERALNEEAAGFNHWGETDEERLKQEVDFPLCPCVSPSKILPGCYAAITAQQDDTADDEEESADSNNETPDGATGEEGQSNGDGEVDGEADEGESPEAASAATAGETGPPTEGTTGGANPGHPEERCRKRRRT